MSYRKLNTFMTSISTVSRATKRYADEIWFLLNKQSRGAADGTFVNPSRFSLFSLPRTKWVFKLKFHFDSEFLQWNGKLNCSNCTRSLRKSYRLRLERSTRILNFRSFIPLNINTASIRAPYHLYPPPTSLVDANRKRSATMFSISNRIESSIPSFYDISSSKKAISAVMVYEYDPSETVF